MIFCLNDLGLSNFGVVLGTKLYMIWALGISNTHLITCLEIYHRQP